MPNEIWEIYEERLAGRDLDRIILTYVRTPDPGVDTHPGTFVWDILRRVQDQTHADTLIRAALDLSLFIDRETHYELVRRGFRWDQTNYRFEGLHSYVYQHVRNQVVDALVAGELEYVHHTIRDANFLKSIQITF